MTTEAAGLGLTEVLMRHRFRGAGEGYSPAVCDCGDWNPRYSVAAEVEHAHHVAEEVHTWLRAALPVVAGTHQFRGDYCICGYSAARSRSRTEHILAAVAETLGAK